MNSINIGTSSLPFSAEIISARKSGTIAPYQIGYSENDQANVTRMRDAPFHHEFFSIQENIDNLNPSRDAKLILAIDALHKKNYEDALPILRLKTDTGDARAPCYLATMYLQGYGVRQDFHKAFRLYEKSAKKGFVRAQMNLATICILNDYAADAFKWTKTAAESGNACAQHNLSLFYCYGYCISKNKEESVRWLTLSLEQKYPLSYSLMGSFYYNGYGVQKSYGKAFDLFNSGASKGDPSAYFNMSIMYFLGHKVFVDNEKAVILLIKAADRGSREAIDLLHNLGHKIFIPVAGWIPPPPRNAKNTLYE